MKRLLFLLFTVCYVLCGQAQGVYDLVLANAVRVTKEPTAGFMQSHVAAFQCSALEFLKNRLDNGEATVEDRLNTQAYYLSEFCELYLKKAVRHDCESHRKDCLVVCAFEQAASEHPLFRSEEIDAETAETVKKWSDCLPFSVNTDWEAAYTAVKQALHSKSDKDCCR